MSKPSFGFNIVNHALIRKVRSKHRLRATYWSLQYKEAPFDRAFVALNRPEFRYTRQYVLRSSDLTAHDRFLSDHYMIKISVKDYVDDADPR